MITADDVKRIREQSATKPKNGKVTADMIANIRQSMAQQNTQQPVQAAPQPTQTTQPAQPIINQPTYANHGVLAQQTHQNIAQRQANIANMLKKQATPKIPTEPQYNKGTEINTGNLGDMAGNAIKDTLSTIGHGAVVGTAKVLDAANMAKDYMTGNDTTLINADNLLNYSNGGRTPFDKRSYYFLENIAKNRPNDLDLQHLYNSITSGKYAGTPEDIQRVLDKSQKYYHDEIYNALVKPSEQKKEDFLQEARTRHSDFSNNLLRGYEATTEVVAPTILTGGLGASAPISMAVGGTVAGENKMQQYLDNGVDYTEAAKNVPIEAAKGALFGTILKAFTPVMQTAGITQNPATLGEAAKNLLVAFRNGAVVGGLANTGAQALDLLKEEPNFEYINWDKVEQGIKDGKYADLDDYLNSSDFTNDWLSSRNSQAFWAGVFSGGFNVVSQVPSTWKVIKDIASNKFNAPKQLEADLKILGLEKGATPQEVRKAAHLLQKKYHSDLTGTTANDAKLQEINEAYNRIQAIQNKTASSFIYKVKQWLSNVGKNAATTQQTQPTQPTQVNNAAVASDQALVPYANNTMTNATNLGNIATQQAANMVQPAPQITENAAQTNLPQQINNTNAANTTTNKITPTTSLETIRDFKEVGNRKVNAYQYDNPEVKPFFQHEANNMLQDLNNAIKGERIAAEDVFGNLNYTGITRETTQDIADLLDGNNGVKLSYDDIRRGLNAIIEDHGAENIAAAKRIEMVLDKRLRKGYTDSYGTEYPANENYQNFLEGKEYIDPAEYERQEAERMLREQGYDVPSLQEDTALESSNQSSFSMPDNTMLPTNDELSNFIQEQNQAELGSVANDVKALNMEEEPPSDNRKVRQHIETIANAPGTPKEVAKDIRNDERKYYVPQSNEETMNNARAIIGDDYAKAERAFLEKPTLEYAEDTAVADLLIQKAIEMGDYQKADELAINLSQKYTNIGQTLQAAKIIKNLTPSGMLIYSEKELEKATRAIKEQSPKLFEKLKQQGVISKNNSGIEKIQLTDAEKKTIIENMEKASKLPDGREKDILVAQTLKTVGNKIPATALEKVASLRRNGLLANFKTLNRNLGSNIVFGLLENVKDIPGTLIDSVTSLVTGNRTTKLPDLGAAFKGLKQGGKNAIQDLWYGIDTTDGSGGKYELPRKAFKRENTWKEIAKTFGNGSIKKGSKMLFKRMLSDYEDIAGFFVNGTDRPFYNARFESELANQMKLGGLKYGEDAPTREMMEIAEEAANYATFKNPNALSKSLSGLRQFLNNGKPIGAADAIGLTFTNVPGSVGTKISDYTVGGYAKAIKQIYNAATKNGKFDQKKFVDYLSRAVTGTSAVILLAPLIATGILRGNYDDDKDKADIEREMGIQQNSINLSALKRYVTGGDPTLQEGDKFYNFDWLQPVSGLAILGSNIYNTIQKGAGADGESVIGELDNENEYYVKNSDSVNIGDVAAETAKTIANQVADMSSLGNFSDLFRGYEGIGGNLIDIPGNFVSSFIPTISNNIGQFSDETARNTKDYTSKWATTINRIINKIPGARETLEPKVNTMGEEKKQYINGNDFASTFLNPGYMTTYSPTDIQKELQSVYEETGDKTIYPSVANSTITSKGETVKLKPKGVTKYQKASGNYASGIYDALLDSEFYKSLEANQKATILKKIADDSNNIGKAAVGIETANYLKLDTIQDELKKNGIPLVDYYLIGRDIKGNDSKSNKQTIIAQNAENINAKDGKDTITADDKRVFWDIFGAN